MNRKPIQQRVFEFTKAVIKHRNRIENSGNSSKNKMMVETSMERINRNLHTNFTERGAIVFFKQFNADILYLIKPGDFEKFNQFNELRMCTGAF